MGQAGCPFVAVFHVYEIFGAKSLAFDVRACVAGRTGRASCVVREAAWAWLAPCLTIRRTGSVDFWVPVQDTKLIGVSCHCSRESSKPRSVPASQPRCSCERLSIRARGQWRHHAVGLFRFRRQAMARQCSQRPILDGQDCDCCPG
jgi:hypothetical protein